MASECSRKRIKSVARLLKVGKIEELLVTKVDEAEGFIDLSRRRVQVDDIKECEERFNNAKKVNNIGKQTALVLGVELGDVYEKIIWPLYHIYPSAHDAFVISLENAADVFSHIDIDPDWRKVLEEQIHKRMSSPEMKVRASFEITCYSEEGIEGIKTVLLEAKKQINENEDGYKISMRMISSPLYEVSTYTTSKSKGIKHIKECLNMIESNAKESFIFKIKDQPVALGSEREEDIESIIRKMAEQDDDTSSNRGEEDNDEGMKF